MDKEDIIYIYIKSNTAEAHTHKKKMPFLTLWMDLEGIMLGEISQTKKEKYCMLLLIF